MSERAVVRHLINLRAGFTPDLPVPPSTSIWLTRYGGLDSSNWSPPAPSIASRRPALRSRGSVRGWIIDPTSRREIVFESILERGLAEILAARREILQLIDQPPAVSYSDSDGRTRKHTFDFLAITTSGLRIAFAVKPAEKVDRSGIKAVIQRIRAQVGTTFADRYLIRTQRHITKDRVYNARLILRSRTCLDPEAITTVAALMPKHVTVCISELVQQSGLAARGFNAIVSLIDLGCAELVGRGRIDYPALIRAGSSTAGELR